MEPEDLDPVAFDAAMCAANLFFSHYGLVADEDARHAIASAILAAFIAAGGVSEQNAERWRAGLKLTHRPTH